MSLPRQIFAVFRKDLLVEWRSFARWSGLFVFALALLLLAAFAAGPGGDSLRKQMGGTLWIALILASTRSLDRSFSVELEQGALEGMVLWPVHALAIYYGKALANAAILLSVAVCITPLAIAIYDAPIQGSVPLYAAFIVLGCTAVAAPGTLLALITAQVRGSSALLPVLLFPLLVPAVIAAGRGTSLVIEGDAMNQATSWLGLLTAFNLIHWGLSGLIFMRLLEER